MMRRILTGAAIALGLPLAACGPSQPAAPPAATAEPATMGVTRSEVVPAATEPAVAPMAAPAVLQSQPGPDGSQVDLLKVAVTGDILTVTLRCSSEQAVNTEAFKLDEISVIDDATAQRIGVLKDNAGTWLASRASGSTMMGSCEKKPGVLWAKFPAPPATSRTVSINFPGVAPFDGVPVTR